jgi:hypothetical protein
MKLPAALSVKKVVSNNLLSGHFFEKKKLAIKEKDFKTF